MGEFPREARHGPDADHDAAGQSEEPARCYPLATASTIDPRATDLVLGRPVRRDEVEVATDRHHVPETWNSREQHARLAPALAVEPRMAATSPSKRRQTRRASSSPAMVGVAPVIANAVFHATGKRIRELPVTPGKLL